MPFKHAFDERLRPAELLLYGLQWLLVAIPVVLTSTVVARQHFPGDMAELMRYTQKLFIVTGATLLAQVCVGHRLPAVPGPASVLLIGVMSVLSASYEAIYTAILTGGAILCLLSVSRLLPRLQPLFTPRILIVILALIALTLMPVILRLVFGECPHGLFALGFTLALCLAMAWTNHRLRGIWKSTVLPLAMALGALVYFLRFGMPETAVAADTAARTPLLLPRLAFDPGVVVAFLFCYLVLLINELGSVQAVAGFVGADRADRRSARAVGITGLFNMAAGGMGVLGPVDYTLSPGIISATGCASRYALLPAGLGLIACGAWPALAGVLSLIPSTVMGAVLLYLMATQLSAALQLCDTARAVRSFEEGLTVGLPLLVAVLLAFLPEEVRRLIPPAIQPVAGNGFVMGVITVLLLEHGLFRRKK